MTDIARLGVQIDTSTVPVATQRLKGFKGEVADVDRVARRFDTRMVSMQLSQVAQQASATGQPLQALAIQLPDIGLAFGTVGIAAGVVAGALLPLIGNLFQTSEALDEIEAMSLGQVRSQIQSLADMQDRYNEAISLSVSVRDEATRKALENLGQEIEARKALLELDLIQMNRRREQLQQTLADRRAELDAMAEQALATLDMSASEEVRTRAVQRVMAANKELTTSIRESHAELTLVNIAIDEAEAGLNGAAGAAGGLLGNLGGAADQAERLAILVERVARVNVYSRNPNESTITGFEAGDPRSGQLNTDFDYGRVSPFAPSRASVSKRRAGGGGASADREALQMQRAAERVIRSLETATQAYNRELADLRELQEMGYLTTEQFTLAQEMLAEELANQQFGDVIQGFDDIADAIAGAIVNSENLGETFGNIIKQMVADLIASNIRNLLMDAFNIGGTPRRGGGILGGLFGILSFDGGGDTPSGPRVGGLDGKGGFMAMLHPNETVIDNTKGGSGDRLEVTVSVQNDGGLEAFVTNTAGQVVARSEPNTIKKSVAATAKRMRADGSFGAPA